MKSAIAFWGILSKDMRTYYLKPPNLSWGIIFPFAWMLMMIVRTKTSFDIQEVFPGIVSMAILFGTTSMLSVTITFERKSRSFERLLLAPISMELLVIAKIAGAIMFGVFNSLVPILVSVLYFKAPVHSWAVLSYGVVFMSTVSTLLGLFISVSASEVFEAQTYSNFFRFPMVFLCGLFLPIAALPLLLQPLSYILPLTYAVDIVRYATNSSNMFSILITIPMLFLFCLALFFLSLHNIKKRWIV